MAANGVTNWASLLAPISSLFAAGYRHGGAQYTGGRGGVDSTHAQATHCGRSVMPYACSNPVLVYSNNDNDSITTVDPLLIGASIEYPAGTFYRAYFPGGTDYYRLEPGGQVTTLPVGMTIPAGAEIRLHTYVSTLPTSARYSIAMTATAGTFAISVGGTATAAIAYNATADAVRAALEAIATVTSGGVKVWGSLGTGSTLYVEFQGPQAGRAITLTCDSTLLTGGTATPTSTQTGGPPTKGWAKNWPMNNLGAEGIDYTADKLLSAATSAAGFGFGPMAVLVQYQNPALPSVYVSGDSIAYGNNEQISDGYAGAGAGPAAGGGYWTRAFGYPATMPYLNGSKGGYSLASDVANRWRFPLYPSCKHAVQANGTNDIFSNGRTLAQLQANLQSWIAVVKSMGVQPWATTVLPRPSGSTDSWATVANQTVVGVPCAYNTSTDFGTGNEGVRSSYNRWLRQNWKSLGLSGLFDVAKVVEHSTDGTLAGATGKWAVGAGVLTAANTAAPTAAPTTDGIHPSSAVHATMAATIAPATTFF